MTARPSRLERVFASLGRISSSGRFIPAIDGLRFVAILLVVLYHLQPTLQVRLGQEGAGQGLLLALISKGDVGVRLFFALSGFILGLPFAEHHLLGKPPVRLGRYFLRRVTRLEPPYLTSLALVALGILLMGRMEAHEVWPHLAASAVYLHNVIFAAPSTIHGVAWSLEVEVQFYVLAPLLTQVFRVKGAAPRRTLIALLLVLGSAANAFVAAHDPQHLHARWYLALPYFLPYFFAGLLLADLHVASPAQPSSAARWDLVGTVGWLVLGAALLVLPEWTGGALAPLIAVAYAGTLRGRVLRNALSQRAIVTLGGMCYTIYLYHYPLLSTLGRITFRLARPGFPFWLNFLVQALVLVPVVLAVCALLFAVGERPFMRPNWWKTLGARRTQSAPEPAPET